MHLWLVAMHLGGSIAANFESQLERLQNISPRLLQSGALSQDTWDLDDPGHDPGTILLVNRGKAYGLWRRAMSFSRRSVGSWPIRLPLR